MLWAMKAYNTFLTLSHSMYVKKTISTFNMPIVDLTKYQEIKVKAEYIKQVLSHVTLVFFFSLRGFIMKLQTQHWWI